MERDYDSTGTEELPELAAVGKRTDGSAAATRQGDNSKAERVAKPDHPAGRASHDPRRVPPLVFRPVSPFELDEEDHRILEDGLSYDTAETSLTDLLDMASSGEVLIWRLDTEGGRGFLTTQVMEYRSGKRDLFLWTVAGVGITSFIEQIIQVLSIYAKQQGCQRVTTRTTRKQMALWLTQRVGFKPLYIGLQWEV